MKKKWITVAVIVLAVVIALVLGGWALLSSAADKDAPQPSPTPTATTSASPGDLPAFNTSKPTPTLPPVETPPATPSPTPTETTAPETVTKDEQGNETVKPNWSTDKLPDDANVVPRQPEANMGGAGGGEIPTGDDGKYHGDQPSEAPATPATTPEPVPTPGTDPAPSPSTSSPSDSGGPPSYNGYNGEKNGAYTWLDGFGWIIPEPDNGGRGGVSGSPDDKLTGNKIGEM